MVIHDHSSHFIQGHPGGPQLKAPSRGLPTPQDLAGAVSAFQLALGGRVAPAAFYGAWSLDPGEEAGITDDGDRVQSIYLHYMMMIIIIMIIDIMMSIIIIITIIKDYKMKQGSF